MGYTKDELELSYSIPIEANDYVIYLGVLATMGKTKSVCPPQAIFPA